MDKYTGKNLLIKCFKCEKIWINGEWIDDSSSDYYDLVRTRDIQDVYCSICTDILTRQHKEIKKQYSAMRN